MSAEAPGFWANALGSQIVFAERFWLWATGSHGSHDQYNGAIRRRCREEVLVAYGDLVLYDELR